VKNIFKQIFGKKEKKMENEVLPGGLAEGKTLEEIAAKHGVPVEELKLELDKGIAVEKEHTPDEKAASEIAMDHLVENPKYYEALKKVEEPAAQPPAQPPLDIEKIVAEAVAKAISALEESKKQEIESAKQKAQQEIEKAQQEAKRLKDENDELHRTQPTGIPDLRGQYGAVEKTETERAHEAAQGYRKGYKGY